MSIGDILGLWIAISLMLGLFALMAIDEWLDENIKLKHIICGLLILPGTVFFTLILTIFYIIGCMFETKFWKKISKVLNKDIF